LLRKFATESCVSAFVEGPGDFEDGLIVVVKCIATGF